MRDAPPAPSSPDDWPIYPVRDFEVSEKEGRMEFGGRFFFRSVLIVGLGLLSIFPIGRATASSLEVFHASQAP